MAFIAPSKDPDEVLDYGIRWDKKLGSETIDTSVWTADPGITKGADSINGLTTIVRMSGGADGVTYKTLNHITASNGEEFEEAIFISVRSK